MKDSDMDAEQQSKKPELVQSRLTSSFFAPRIRRASSQGTRSPYFRKSSPEVPSDSQEVPPKDVTQGASKLNLHTVQPSVEQPEASSSPTPPQKPKHSSPTSSAQPRSPPHTATATTPVIYTFSIPANVPIFHTQQSASSTATPSMPLFP